MTELLRDDPTATPQIEAWLSEYATTRDPRLRERIVLAYLGLAQKVASRFRETPTLTREDLLQTARAGLVAAVNRYDPDRGVPFVSYVVACMVGEIKRSLRDTSWRLHVARPVKNLALAALGEVDQLRVQLGRSPTLAEIAARLHTSQEQVAEAIEAANTRVVWSLDRPLLADGRSAGCLADTLAAQAPTVEREDLLVLPELLAQLPETERRVVMLYFFEELRQHDIGRQLGCSQMQVSRLLRSAIARLRSMLVP
jgi:RNA polymerase sigma-B factor